MYFPYLRGRQNELFALRELAFNKKIFANEAVLPIIEPVTLSGVKTSYKRFVSLQIPFILIANPLVGKLSELDVKNNLINGILKAYDGYYIGYLIHQQTTLKAITKFMQENDINSICFIHYSEPGDSGVVGYINQCSNIEHNIFLSSLTKRYVNSIKNTDSKVLLEDGFNKAPTNKEYLQNPNEHFCNEHFEYNSKGYTGFGDFCTIGEQFDDKKKFTPVAVAIHWTYLADKNNTIKINHFVSDTNDKSLDTGSQFIEAYKKLSTFFDTDSLFKPTLGSNAIRRYGDKGKYPSLGPVKKMSIMSHIELMRNTF